MDEYEKKLKGKFETLKSLDKDLAPAFPNFEIVTAIPKKPVVARLAPWGGAIAACFAVVFAMTLPQQDPIDPDEWMVAELPQWATSTDALLSVSDRALPIVGNFEPLNIEATFGQSLTLGRQE